MFFLHIFLSITSAFEFPLNISTFTLANGMKFIVVPRKISQTVSFRMFFNVGSIYDPVGKSGLAHLFEHMLFKGTNNIGTKNYKKEIEVENQIDKLYLELKEHPEKKEQIKLELEKLEAELTTIINPEEYEKIYQKNGAEELNAGTGKDFTVYTISLPSKNIELWFKMESERMRNPVLREFYKERDVVIEERIMRYENSPDGRLWENFLRTAFNLHYYGRPIVGWTDEILNIFRDDAYSFFRDYYSTNNCVVAIVGDVELNQIFNLAKKYFGSISSSKTKLPYLPKEPQQKSTKRVTVYFDAQPKVLIGYHVPEIKHKDSAALEIISLILTDGQTSRLYKKLVEKKISLYVYSNTSPSDKYPRLFFFNSAPNSPHTTSDIEKIIFDEVENLKIKGATDYEIQKAKNKFNANIYREMYTNGGFADNIGYFDCITSDWSFIKIYIEDVNKVTNDEIIEVAKKYFNNENLIIADLQKK